MHNVSALLSQATQRYEQARAAFSEQARKYYPDYDKLPPEMPKSMLESYMWSSATAAALSKITGGNSSHAFRYGIMGAVGCLINVVLRNEINKRLPALSSTAISALRETSTAAAATVNRTVESLRKEGGSLDDSPVMVTRTNSPGSESGSLDVTSVGGEVADKLGDVKGKLGIGADPLLKNPAFQNAVLRTVVVVGGLHALNVAFGDGFKVARVFINVAAVLAVTAYQTNQTFAGDKVTPWPFL
ncbi:MAG: hypothetical protein HKM07_07345 [Chlamydiae bacterium]|nr:hypothetical protein [Chlamydiota bacterium]